MSDVCGSTDTRSGEPCQFPSGENCPHHTTNRGRPTKFTEERKQKILEAARKGTSVEGCARAGGVHVSTLIDWREEYSKFSESFKRARSVGEDRLVDKVMDRDPKFLLERSFGYTKKQTVEHEGDTGVLVVPGMAEDEDEWEQNVKAQVNGSSG